MQQPDSENNTRNKAVLEICVDSVQSALAAQEGGAQRIELCSSLSEGGITPGAGMTEIVRKSISIEMHVLIRPGRGDFLYSAAEFDIIKKDIKIARELKADGVVTGILKADGSIDSEKMKELATLAHPLHITFHRAFDLTPDTFRALDELMELKIPRLLTSGQQETAYKGMKLIARLIERAGTKLSVMPGGGINPQNIREICEKTAATEFHASARKKINSRMLFQRDRLSMGGGQLLSEYEQLVADPEQIKAIRRAL